ncbi:MAG: hypothetical protein IPF44_16155 [Betaproteobacteria bacterium]|jgi:hypothetical protein|nr:hypothetical protein [Betaproteobacteria bacterium]MBK7464642.1 hypothetical protein [Betaproteobacteria bacterium]
MNTNIVPFRQWVTPCVAGIGLLILSAPLLADEAYRIEEISPILKQHPCKKTCKVQGASGEYTLSPIDLNGDGIVEYLVHNEACGSGGCADGLFMFVGNGWKKLLEVAVGGMEVASTRTNGFANVVIWQESYEPQRHTVRHLYRWNGQRYVAK